MRRAFAFVLVATSCGLVGSTVGYSGGKFCDTHDAAIFCSGFDEPTLPWATYDASNNPIMLTVEEGPHTMPVSPPNVLHISVDGGNARANRLHASVPANGTLVCDLDFEMLAPPEQAALIAWLEIDDSNGLMLHNGGLVVGATGAGAGTCTFTDAGVTCARESSHAMDAGHWQHATMTFTGFPAGLKSVTVDFKDGKPGSFADAGFFKDAGVAVAVGLASDMPLDGANILIDNVVCQ